MQQRKAIDPFLIFVLLLACCVSFCSMSYELLIARYLGSLSLDTVTSQSITVGTYLLSLGIGAYLHSHLRIRSPQKTFILIEVLITISASIGMHAILFMHLYFEGSRGMLPFPKGHLLIATTQMVTVLIGVLSGFEIPILIDMVKERYERAFGWVLGVSYIGGFLAAVLISLSLVPAVGTLMASLIIALATAVVAAISFLAFFFKRPSWVGILLIPALFLPPYLARSTPQVMDFYLKSFYYLAPSSWNFAEIKQTLKIHKSLPEVQRIASPYQEIDVVLDESRRSFHLFLDHKLQFSSQNEKVYHDLMIHGALNLAAHKPRKALIIGGGDGLLAREILKYQSLDSVTLVELDPKVIELATKFSPLVRLNNGALRNPKVKTVVADGYNWLRTSNEKFDCIFIDLPHPHSFELSRLYSTEFYRFVAKRLEDKGFMVFDFPFFPLLKASENRPKALVEGKSVMESVRAAGFKSSATYGFYESFLIGSLDERTFSFNYQKLENLVSSQTTAQLALLNESAFEKVKSAPNSIFKPSWLREGFDGD